MDVEKIRSTMQEKLDLSNIFLPFKLEIDENVRSATCGINHSVVVTKDLKVLSWGLGANGRLGINPKSNPDF